jgi:hypothetical protein
MLCLVFISVEVGSAVFYICSNAQAYIYITVNLGAVLYYMNFGQ